MILEDMDKRVYPLPSFPAQLVYFPDNNAIKRSRANHGIPQMCFY
jgi:hypothetical protein